MATPVILATRGSALALAQAHQVKSEWQRLFPDVEFQIKVIKTSGDKLQTASLSHPPPALPKGLFTKELETALIEGEADVAIHSLKDLPTELPAGLVLGAVPEREDVRDVLVRRGVASLPHSGMLPAGTEPEVPFVMHSLPGGATIATSSNRRKAQLLSHRPDLKVMEIRGNVGTRLRKLAESMEIHGLVLAAAGLKRLRFLKGAGGELSGEDVPIGLVAQHLKLDEMLPCVGQGALGLEIRESDRRLAMMCERLNDSQTCQCVMAERAFLKAMGGGCASPVGAYAEVLGEKIRLRVIAFAKGATVRRDESAPVADAAGLGERLARGIGASAPQ